jgi:hypothetical protein
MVSKPIIFAQTFARPKRSRTFGDHFGNLLDGSTRRSLPSLRLMAGLANMKHVSLSPCRRPTAAAKQTVTDSLQVLGFSKTEIRFAFRVFVQPHAGTRSLRPSLNSLSRWNNHSYS